MNAIEMKNVTKHYEGFSLDNVSFTLPSGCIIGLVGENGAGKSTTINLIMNAIKRDGGSISVLGVDNSGKEFVEVKEDIGIVLDEAYFNDVLTPRQVNSIMKNTYKRWDENCYFNYLKKLSLPEKKMFKDFSRGMKMKLAIAVALSHSPKLLILDEATSGLDPIVRDEVLDIFNDFTRDESNSILISSHIISDLEKICDYIGFIHKGKMMFCEEKDLLIEKYGVVHLSKAELESIPRNAIKGIKESEFSIEALVERDKVSPSLNVERTTIENIVLFLVKGGEK